MPRLSGRELVKAGHTLRDPLERSPLLWGHVVQNRFPVFLRFIYGSSFGSSPQRQEEGRFVSECFYKNLKDLRAVSIDQSHQCGTQVNWIMGVFQRVGTKRLIDTNRVNIQDISPIGDVGVVRLSAR